MTLLTPAQEKLRDEAREFTATLVAEVDGATFAVMKDIGHFGMPENPEAFKKYFLSVLEQAADR
jgi:pimeloyl-ACP methyl ester carboxylesterase